MEIVFQRLREKIIESVKDVISVATEKDYHLSYSEITHIITPVDELQRYLEERYINATLE